MQGIESFIQQLSGIELHLHAEGAIPKDFLWLKRKKNDSQLTREQFESEFNYSNFKEFVKHWCLHQKLLFAKPEAYDNFEESKDLRVHPAPTELLPVIAKSLITQRINYAELHVSPIDGCFMAFGRDLTRFPDFYLQIVKAWQLACQQWNQQNSERLTIKLILDLVRNYPSEILKFQIDCLSSLQDETDQFVAVGLGGGNDSKSLLEFKSSFAKTRDMGLGLVVHAGEHLPVEVASRELGEALELGVDRIGHGIYGFQDHIKRLIDQQVTLEICPTSNLMTGSVTDMKYHPLKVLIESEVKYVVGSDDPVYFGTTFWNEMQLVSKISYGGSERDQKKGIQSLLIAAIEASYADDNLKKVLLKKIYGVVL